MRKLNHRGNALIGSILIGSTVLPFFDNLYHMVANWETVGQAIIILIGFLYVCKALDQKIEF